MKPFLSRVLLSCGAGVAIFGSFPQPAAAAEPRTWISIDGRTTEAELVRRMGPEVELRDVEGRVFKVALTALSFGDQDYVNEFAPENKGGSLPTLGASAAKPKLPNPAREAKLDTKAFKKEAGFFPVNNHTYTVCETPHFKVLYLKPVDPMDVAELAERLWLDHAFFHSTFAQKWKDRKMAIMVVNDEQAYEYAGSWYADMIEETGDKESAGKIRATWPRSASGTINLPPSMAEQNGVITRMRVFRAFEPGAYGEKTRPNFIKGVWIPFRTHCLASDMLQIQAGGISGIGAEGSFAVFTGHAYYKEILLTGKSETSIVRAVGTRNDVSDVGGFKDAKNWAAELKKRVKKGDAKTSLTDLFKRDSENADEMTTVLAYAFARFLQSSQEKLGSFNRLCERISTSNQIPEPDELAKFYGLEDGAALEKAWVAYMLSPEFR